MDEYTEVIILDDDVDDDFRNAASRDHRTSRGQRSPIRSRLGSRGRRAIVRQPQSSATVSRTRVGSGPIVRNDTGGLSTGMLIEAGAQVLAAMQTLPLAPVATGKVEQDLANMVLYQTALAEHAKRDEQLRTLGSLASKLFA